MNMYTPYFDVLIFGVSPWGVTKGMPACVFSPLVRCCPCGSKWNDV